MKMKNIALVLATCLLVSGVSFAKSCHSLVPHVNFVGNFTCSPAGGDGVYVMPTGGGQQSIISSTQTNCTVTYTNGMLVGTSTGPSANGMNCL